MCGIGKTARRLPAMVRNCDAWICGNTSQPRPPVHCLRASRARALCRTLLKNRLPRGRAAPESVRVSSKKPAQKANRAKTPPSSGLVVFITVILPIIALTGLLIWMMVPSTATPPVVNAAANQTQPKPAVPPAPPAERPPQSPSPMPAAGPTREEPTPPPVPATPKEKATALVNEGARLFEEGRLEEALARYAKAREYSPDDEEVYFSQGAIFSKMGRISEAITNYLHAIEIFPGYSEAKNNLGNLYVSLGRFDEAIPLLESVIELRPDTASGYNNLGTALARQKRFAEAAKRFEEAIRLQPDYPEAHLNLGVAQLTLGNLERATNSLKTALKLRPDLTAAQQALNRALSPSSLSTNRTTIPFKN